MATFSNQGRTVPELPRLNSSGMSNDDLLIIQSQSSNSTKSSTLTEFSKKSADIITSLNNLNFKGPNNKFVGSIRNYEADSYSVINSNVPNLLKRLSVTDYLEIGYNPSVSTQLQIYSNVIQINQFAGGSITAQGNGNSSTISLLSYRGGLYLTDTPLIGSQITASYSPYGFSGNLKGDVQGNVTSTGTSTFATLNVSNLNVNIADITQVTINGGTVNNTTIGSSIPSSIIGTTITATSGFVGSLTAPTITVTNLSATNANLTTVSAGTISVADLTSTIITSDRFTGPLTGSVRGDIYSNTGTKVLENGSGGTPTAYFYGTSSYSRNGLQFSSFSSSYALTSSFAITSSRAVTASYVKSGSFAKRAETADNCVFSVADEADYLNWFDYKVNGTASYSYNGDGKYSSYSSSFAYKSISSSFAQRALSVAGTVDNAIFATSAGSANTSVSSSFTIRTYTASYLRQDNNKSYTIPYYNGRILTSTANATDDGNNSYGELKWVPNYSNIDINLLIMSSSRSRNFVIIDSKAANNFAQSHLVLSVNNNRVNRIKNTSYLYGPESYDLFVDQSGSLNLQTFTGSLQFTNQNFTSKGIRTYFNPLKTVNNVFYFWPEPYSYQSVMRDGSVGIGVTSPDYSSNVRTTRAKLHINVFSSSVVNLGTGAWPGDATVRPLAGAICVTYGSGSVQSSLTTTFSVSGSGNVYCLGNSIVSGSLKARYGITGSLQGKPFRTFSNKQISFWGTGSNAVSSSYATTAGSLVGGNPSIFNFLSSPVAISVPSYNTFQTVNLTTINPSYANAKIAILYVELTVGSNDGNSGTMRFSYRKNNTDSTKYGAYAQGSFGGDDAVSNGNSSQIFVQLDTTTSINDPSFQLKIEASGGWGYVNNVSLIGYIS